MAKRSSSSRKPAQAAVKHARCGKPETPATVVVTAEQRRSLIEDIAYFQAQRYRAVEPGGFREEDRRAARAEIESLLEKTRQ